jgi:hypothetical protein
MTKVTNSSFFYKQNYLQQKKHGWLLHILSKREQTNTVQHISREQVSLALEYNIYSSGFVLHSSDVSGAEGLSCPGSEFLLMRGIQRSSGITLAHSVVSS